MLEGRSRKWEGKDKFYFRLPTSDLSRTVGVAEFHPALLRKGWSGFEFSNRPRQKMCRDGEHALNGVQPTFERHSRAAKRPSTDLPARENGALRRSPTICRATIRRLAMHFWNRRTTSARGAVPRSAFTNKTSPRGWSLSDQECHKGATLQSWPPWPSWPPSSRKSLRGACRRLPQRSISHPVSQHGAT
jgi:hypothetical protein